MPGDNSEERHNRMSVGARHARVANLDRIGGQPCLRQRCPVWSLLVLLSFLACVALPQPLPSLYAAGTTGPPWQVQSAAGAPGTSTLWSVSCAGRTHCVAVGDHGTLLQSADNGATWTGRATGQISRVSIKSRPV